MKTYTVQTHQPAAIVQEYQIEATSEENAKEIVERLLSERNLPEPLYTGTETVGQPEIISAVEM
jgi:hypothetical protein